MPNLLPQSFFIKNDVVNIAKELLGKVLVTNFNGQYTSGIITETEAYCGVTDKASHAYGGRRTNRTETMYQKGGICYVYLCYGIHHLFNVVTNKENIPHAVLIRAVKPMDGLNLIKERRRFPKKESLLSSGPGTMSEALGIKTTHNNLPLNTNSGIWIEDRKITINPTQIITTPRIGVDYAAEDALLPYRFLIDLQ